MEISCIYYRQLKRSTFGSCRPTHTAFGVSQGSAVCLPRAKGIESNHLPLSCGKWNTLFGWRQLSYVAYGTSQPGLSLERSCSHGIDNFYLHRHIIYITAVEVFSSFSLYFSNLREKFALSISCTIRMKNRSEYLKPFFIIYSLPLNSIPSDGFE